MPCLPHGVVRAAPVASYRIETVTTHRRPPDGEGTVRLVADRARGDFGCYWYAGRAEDQLAERARATSAEAAVAWGRARTTRVRIRTIDGRSQWAGSAPQPDDFCETWVSDQGRGAAQSRGGA